MTIPQENISTTGPRICTLWYSTLEKPSIRLDSKHYQEEFITAKNRIAHCGYNKVNVSDVANAYVPNRAKLVLSGQEEAGAPYLKAHDAFELRPSSKRYMSKARTDNYDDYLLKPGMILTPSSGRNLGPVTYVGKKLSQFAMTDIMRIVPFDEKVGYYLLAYLLTPTGQAMVRRGRTGTNIDHLSPADVLSIPVVVVDDLTKKKITKLIQEAETLLDEARIQLDDLENRFHQLARLRLPIKRSPRFFDPKISCFNQSSSQLYLRIDPAFYDPTVQEIRAALKKAGGITLESAATLVQLGRYKRYYVVPEFGRPILSGRHLFQLRQVNLQYISDRSFRSPGEFVLEPGWTVFTCDGRAEEQLGSPAYVHSGWKGWMASNHVMRAIPKGAVPSGFLYLAIRSPYVQIQIKSRATGSVIDALDPDGLADVIIPTLAKAKMEELGNAVEIAWEAIAKAQRLEDKAVSMLEGCLVKGYEKYNENPN